jgi:hypothetical protein
MFRSNWFGRFFSSLFQSDAPAAALFEALEQRALFSVMPEPGPDFSSAFNVGDLNGSVTLNDSVSQTDAIDFYKFSMPRAGQFFGRIRIQSGQADVSLFQETFDARGNPIRSRLSTQLATRDGRESGFATGDLPGQSLAAGNYYVVISLRTDNAPYLIRMTADYAGNSLRTARNIGSVTDATFPDFLGNGDSPSLIDTSDFYKFKMDAPGKFSADMRTDDPADLTENHLEIIQDVNGNGAIDPGDLITATDAGTTVTRIISLPAGAYFLQVVNEAGASNYHVRITADYAGSVAGTRRVTGSLDAGKSFNDFINAAGKPLDTLDEYQFSVGSAHPLNLVFVEAGGGKSELTLFKDRNSDGIADTSEIVLSTEPKSFGNFLDTVQPGNYILQIKAISGGGTYQLFAEARPDQAGNSLGSARNLNTVNGLIHQDEFVSGQDPVDFFKFTASGSGRVSAQLNPQLGDDANLALIRDANNNGKVDPGETLAASTLPGNRVDELTSPIAAGTYFLRVNFNGLEGEESKYFLSFHTDYAGSTPATARNVGTLTGKRTFDDWASGPFTGVISDTADVYRLKLTSAKPLAVKLTGVLGGQDLNLELFRDINNDGVLSPNELMASSNKVDSSSEQISRSLVAGTYFVRVVGVNGETNYHLTMSA